MTTKNHGPYIKTEREAKGYSQQQMADFLSISRTSYINIEQGTREITLTEAGILANLFGVTLQDISEEKSPNIEKFKSILLAFLKLHVGEKGDSKMPKTKLAKLIYLADFAWFYEHLESMSGMQYKKLEYGPVSDVFFRVVDEMFEQGDISIETKSDAMLVSLNRSAQRTENNNLNKQELALIQKIHKKWEHKRTNEIVAFTHSQMPWRLGRDGEVVHYELITQEDPDRVY